MYLYLPKTDPLTGAPLAHAVAPLTELSVPKLEVFNLIGKENSSSKSDDTSDVPVPHWRTRVVMSVMTDDVAFDKQQMPGELVQYIQNRVDRKTSSYYPIAVPDHMNFRIKDLQVSSMNLTISLFRIAATH
jgi:Cleft lip and palate transmembrane protein 1 (CLPTM1).